MENTLLSQRGGYFHDYIKKHGLSDGAVLGQSLSSLPPPPPPLSLARNNLTPASGAAGARHAHRIAGENITDRAAYVSFLETQLERVSSKVLQTDTIQEVVDNQARQIADLNEKVAALTKLISLTQTYTEQQGKEAGAAVAELQTSVTALQQRDDEASERLSSIESWGKSIDENVEALHRLVERHISVEARVQAVEQQGAQLVEAVTQLQRDGATKDELRDTEARVQDAADEAERASVAAEETAKSAAGMLTAAERARDGAVSAEASALRALEASTAAQKEVAECSRRAQDAESYILENANRAEVAAAAATAALKAVGSIVSSRGFDGATGPLPPSPEPEAAGSSSSGSQAHLNTDAQSLQAALTPLFKSFFEEVKLGLTAVHSRCDGFEAQIGRLGSDLVAAEERRGASIHAAEEKGQSRADALAAEIDETRAMCVRLQDALQAAEASLDARVDEEACRLEQAFEEGLAGAKAASQAYTDETSKAATEALRHAVEERQEALSAQLSGRIAEEVQSLEAAIADARAQAKTGDEALSSTLTSSFEAKLQAAVSDGVAALHERLSSAEASIKRVAWLLGGAITRDGNAGEGKAAADGGLPQLSSALFPHLRDSIAALVDSSVSASDAAALRRHASDTSTIDTAKDALSKAAAALASIATLTASVDSLAASLSSLRSDFTRHCEGQATSEQDLASALSAIREQLASMQQQIQAADTEQQQLIRAADGLVTRWNAAHESITELRDTLAGLAGEVATLRMVVEALASRPVREPSPPPVASPPPVITRKAKLPMRVASFRASKAVTLAAPGAVGTATTSSNTARSGTARSQPPLAVMPQHDEHEAVRAEQEDDGEDEVVGEDRDDEDQAAVLQQTARSTATASAATGHLGATGMTTASATSATSAAASNVSPKEMLRIFDTMVQPRMQSIASELHARLSAEVTTIAMRAGVAAAQAQQEAKESTNTATTATGSARNSKDSTASAGADAPPAPESRAESSPAPQVPQLALLPPSAGSSEPATFRDSRTSAFAGHRGSVIPLPEAEPESSPAAAPSQQTSEQAPQEAAPSAVPSLPIPALPASLPASARNSLGSAASPSAQPPTTRGRQPAALGVPPLPLTFRDTATAHTEFTGLTNNGPVPPPPQSLENTARSGAGAVASISMSRASSTASLSQQQLALKAQQGGLEIRSGADLVDWLEGGERGLASSPTKKAEAATQEAIAQSRRQQEQPLPLPREQHSYQQGTSRSGSPPALPAQASRSSSPVAREPVVIPPPAIGAISAGGTRLERELLTSRTGSSASASASVGMTLASADTGAAMVNGGMGVAFPIRESSGEETVNDDAPLQQQAPLPQQDKKKPRPTNNALGRGSRDKPSGAPLSLPQYDEIDNAPPEDALLADDGEEEELAAFGSASARETPTEQRRPQIQAPAAGSQANGASSSSPLRGPSKTMPSLQQLAFPDTAVAAAGYLFGPQGSAAPLPIVMTASGKPGIGVPVSRRNEREKPAPQPSPHNHQHQPQKRNAAVGAGMFGRANDAAGKAPIGPRGGMHSAGSSRRSSLASSVDFGAAAHGARASGRLGAESGTIPAPAGVDIGKLYGGRFERPHPGFVPAAAPTTLISANPDDIVLGDERHTAKTRNRGGPTVHAGAGVLGSTGGSQVVLVSPSNPAIKAGMGLMAAMMAAAPSPRLGQTGGSSSVGGDARSVGRSTSRGTASGDRASQLSPGRSGAAATSSRRNSSAGRGGSRAGSVSRGASDGTTGGTGAGTALGKLPSWYTKRAEELGQQTAKAATEINLTMGVAAGLAGHPGGTGTGAGGGDNDDDDDLMLS